MPYSHDYADISACVDCLSLLANGEVTDELGLDATQPHAAQVDIQWPSAAGWQLVPACEEECDCHFSWQACEACGSQLGGDRHPVAVFRYVREEMSA